MLTFSIFETSNKIIVVARDSEKLRSIKKQFSKIETFQCDLTKQQDLDELILCVEQNYPNCNMLINNAGVQYNYNFITDHDIINKIDYEINTNLTATIKLCALLLPTLSKNNNTTTVNVGNGLAILPKKSAPVYCAIKVAIHNFTKALRY